MTTFSTNAKKREGGGGGGGGEEKNSPIPNKPLSKRKKVTLTQQNHGKLY